MQINESHDLLTRAQHSMWKGHHYHGSYPFHTAEWLVIEGPLDRELFQKAVYLTLKEAKSLHWRALVQGEHVYRVDDVTIRKPSFVDLSQLDEEEILAWAEKEVEPAFNLESGHLYDYVFAHLGEQKYGLFFKAHHVALDGYAYGLMISRFIDYYQSLKNGTELKIKGFDHYEKFIAEEQHYLHSEKAKKDLDFWKANFSYEKAPKKRLKRKLKEPFSQGPRYEEVIDWSTQLQLNALATELKLPSALIVMAVMMSYLIKHSKDPQQCFGVPFMSRLGTSSMRIPCLVMNILPLRLGITGQENLKEIILLLTKRFAEIRPHQQSYFEQMRFVLEDFDPYENILFGPIVNWIPYPLPEHFEGCKLTKTTISAGPIEDFDTAITNKFVDGIERLYLAVDGHKELYDVPSLKAYWYDFMEMMKTWLAQPELVFEQLQIHKPLPE
ncbi:condensation domain-containing protein [Acinetobacter sp. YH16032]|uniref:condensation domain-containing protein n=1 Tax=Acinetobacter sp. YH16032 TaxID=2601181 RepID=UPI0015D1F700|nr:condensation domain-containing protein [Acinetobacter sp. YH16032]